MVEPEVGPDEASPHPLILLSGSRMLLGGLARLDAFARMVSLRTPSRLISSSIKFENRYRNIHLPRFTVTRQCGDF